jgi:hypothetical protein
MATSMPLARVPPSKKSTNGEQMKTEMRVV